MKVIIRNKSGLDVVVDMNKNTRLYPHFKLWELANNKGNPKEPQYLISPDQDEFMFLVEKFRALWNQPINVNSNYRQADYNKSVGGSVNSLHLLAEALDVDKPNMSSAERDKVVRLWQDICTSAGKVGGINLYKWGFHIDASEWRYGYKSFVVRNYL